MPFPLNRVMRLFPVRERSCRRRPRAFLRLVELETRTLLSVQLPGPNAIGERTSVASGPVAAADLNGDGKLDIVASNLFDNSVSVLLGNGDGTFRPRKDYPTGLFPSSVVIADVNGDGKPDIIVANQNGNSVSVLLGNGDGTFQPKADYPVGQYPASVVVADVNRDGKPDIIVANLLDSTVSVLLGSGDGSFRAGPTVHLPKDYGLASVAVADLYGDRKLDLVTADSYRNTVSVMRGNGDGSFQSPRDLIVDSGPASVVVADVNGDGKPDIITANAGNSVSVLLGNGDGSFKTVPKVPFGVDSQPRSVAVADVNGDGVPDIITANYGGSSGGSVSVLSGNGNGTFRLPRFFDEGSSPVSVLVADVNGGGKPDIITDYEVFNPQSNNILLRQGVRALFGNGDGSFTRSTTIFETTFITSLSAFLSQFSPGVLSPSFNDVAALLSGLSLPGSQSFLTVAAVPGVTSLSATTMPVLMSSPAPPPPPKEPGSPGDFDRLPPDPDAQPPRLNLPTERDILAEMDVAGSLLRRTRPQANLVPQPGVGANVEYVPGDAEDGAKRTGRLRRSGTGEMIDVAPYLISPVEDTLLGPPPAPGTVPPPGLTWAYSLAFEILWQRWQGEDDVEISGDSRDSAAWPSAQLRKEDLVLALAFAGVVLLERRSAEERKQAESMWTIPDDRLQ